MSGTETALLSASLAKPRVGAARYHHVHRGWRAASRPFSGFRRVQRRQRCQDGCACSCGRRPDGLRLSCGGRDLRCHNMLADEEDAACAPRSFKPSSRAAVVCGEGPSSKVSAMQRQLGWGRDGDSSPSGAGKASARKVNKNSSKSAKRRFKIITSGSILRSRRTKKTNLYDR